MQRNYAVHSATNTIDIVLDKGAQKLYDKYLNQKLPGHTHVQNNAMVTKNLNLQQVTKPTRNNIQSIPFCSIQTAAIDSHAPKRIVVNKQRDKYSTLSPKNTTFGKSTKYQTIISGTKSNITKQKPEQLQNQSLMSQQPAIDTSISFKGGRPMTMQVGRTKRDSNLLAVQSKLQEVEEKRAATCHVRNRKKYVSAKQKMSKMVKIKKEQFILDHQDKQVQNCFIDHMNEKMQKNMQKQQQRAKIDAYYRMRQKRTKESFEAVKNKLKGKSKEPVAVTNFETSNGDILINGKPKQQRTHIIQLQFNPQQQRTLKSQEPKIAGVNSTKKNVFATKLKKKLKVTDEQYTNNGSRQISSIPFVNLSYGISLSQSILDATASRRRPIDQINRDQFNKQNTSNKFKSHIPIVNTARLNKMFATIDQGTKTARSEVFEYTNTLSIEKKDFQTTYESRKQIADSLLWKPRPKSQGRNIRITNKEAYDEQILDLKLGQ